MRRLFLFIFLISCVLVSSSNGGENIQFQFAPEFGFYSGETEYSLRVEYAFVDETSTTVDAAVASRLQFPLDAKLGGASLKMADPQDKYKWSIKIYYLTSLTNPSDKMIDSDWNKALPYYDETLYSYTESEVEMNMYAIGLDLTYRLFQLQKVAISLAGGFRYQKIEQDVIGYSGFQLPFQPDNTYGDPIYFSGDEDAIYYEIKIKQPNIGVQADVDMNHNFSLAFKALYAPIFFNNFDDHLIRGKISTAKGDGKGFTGQFAANLIIPTSSDIKPFLGLVGEINTYEANGIQRQEWYIDEGDIPAGTVIPSIPHKVKGTQYLIGLKAGLQF